MIHNKGGLSDLTRKTPALFWIHCCETCLIGVLSKRGRRYSLIKVIAFVKGAYLFNFCILEKVYPYDHYAACWVTLMRVYHDVILGLTTAHWPGHVCMNCWCPTDWPHTVGPASNRLLPSHRSAHLTRDLILRRLYAQRLTCTAQSGHSLSLLLGGVPVNPRC